MGRAGERGVPEGVAGGRLVCARGCAPSCAARPPSPSLPRPPSLQRDHPQPL